MDCASLTRKAVEAWLLTKPSKRFSIHFRWKPCVGQTWIFLFSSVFVIYKHIAIFVNLLELGLGGGISTGNCAWYLNCPVSGIVLCSRSKSWKGFCIYLSWRDITTMDVPRFPRNERIGSISYPLKLLTFHKLKEKSNFCHLKESCFLMKQWMANETLSRRTFWFHYCRFFSDLSRNFMF